jgi:hypothetical protein
MVGAPGSINDIGSDLERVRTRGTSPTLQRAVVIDVIMDPNMITDAQLDFIKTTVSNPEFAEIMPVNSIVAKLVSDSQGRTASSNTILFPFFSSHFMLPVQPGETVEVMYEDYAGGGTALGYWVTRISAERTVEDVNYTHYDRRYDPSLNPSNYSTTERRDRSEDQPEIGFPNGGNTPQSLTLALSSSNARPFEQIIQTATAYSNANNGLVDIETDGTIPLVTPEPVPRWRKRPQELVFQGANNTLICLGEDRKGGPLGALEEENPDAKTQAGTIDMVVGRGRHLPSDATAHPDDQQEDEERSPNAPLIEVNTRGTDETNKAPYRRIPGEPRLKDNPTEGDPDFVQDAARLYVTMQSEVDNNFGITETTYTQDTLPEGDNKNEIPQPGEGETGTTNKSYVVGKADHIRLIARKDEDRSIEGTILLLREGTSEEDLDYIYLDKNGIHIEGPKVILGRGLGKLAAAGGDPTPGGEPYIRWSKFRDTVDSLHEELKIVKDNLQLQIDQMQAQLLVFHTAIQTAGPTSLCIPFVPDPAVVAIGAAAAAPVAAIPTGAGPASTGFSNITSKLPPQKQETDDAVEASKSEKIFGE